MVELGGQPVNNPVDVWFNVTLSAPASVVGYRMGQEPAPPNPFISGNNNIFPQGSRVACQIQVANTSKDYLDRAGLQWSASDGQSSTGGGLTLGIAGNGVSDWITVGVVSAIGAPTHVPQKYHWDGKNCVASDTGEYDTLDQCQLANSTKKTTTTTGEDEIKKGIQDLENAHNFNDLMTGIGEVLGGIGGVIGGIGSDIGSAIWDSIPKSITDWFSSWVDFFTGVHEFFVTPGAFYRKHQAALWESGSPPPIPAQMDSSQAEIKSRLAAYKANSGNTLDLVADIKSYLDSSVKTVTDLFASPTDVSGAEATSFGVSTAALFALLSAVGINLIPELLPTENFTGVAFLTNTIIDALGVPGYIRDYWAKRYDVSVGQLYSQYLNEKYHPSLPQLGELISERQKNLITNEDFTASASRTTGLNTDRVGYAYKAALAVPGFADVILYHHRHPTEAVDFGALQDWMGINYVDYKKYFDERQWNDIPIRTLKMVYQSGAIPLSDVDNRIRRQGLRSDILPGDTLSDFQVMHNYVTESQEATLEKQLLQSTLKLFLEGKTGLTDLQAAASKVYSDPMQLTTYMQTAQNKVEAEKLKSVKEKTFTYSLLIKLAESGVDVTPFMDSDLTAENWDAAHKTAIEAYITATLAKKNLGVNGQPLPLAVS